MDEGGTVSVSTSTGNGRALERERSSSLSLSLERESYPRSETEFYVGNRFFCFCTSSVSKILRSGTFFCPRVVNPSSGLGGVEGRQKPSVCWLVCCKPEFWIGRCPRVVNLSSGLGGVEGRQKPSVCWLVCPRPGGRRSWPRKQ
jgi:hypothetical protein